LHPLRHAATVIFDSLTLNVYSRSDVTWSNSVPNLSKMEQSPAELLTISQFFSRVWLPNSTPQRG